MAMVLINGGDLSINPAHVASMRWERRDYMNCSPVHWLVIRMADGKEHRIEHAPRFHGADAYEIERKIIEALAQQNSREGE